MDYKSSITTVFLFFCVRILTAQTGNGEYFVSFDYETMNYERIASLPDITWVGVNSTYDADQKRFFFAGVDEMQESWKIFTIDATSGHILYNPELYTSAGHNSFYAIEYDKDLKKLFTLYYDYTDDATYFAEIAPSTGKVYIINEIYGLDGFVVMSSTYDEAHHRFIFIGYYAGSIQIIAIDGVSGNIVFTYAAPPGQDFRYLDYSNVEDALYSITSVSSAEPVFILETISTLSGAINIIGEFPAVSTNQVGANEIDEPNGRFIFSGTEGTSDYLYAVNIFTGELEGKWPDPYLNAASAEKENIIFFAYDDISAVLYALNWGPEKIPTPEFTGSTLCVNEKMIAVSPNPGTEKIIISFGQIIEDASIVIYNDLHQAMYNLHIFDTDHVDLQAVSFPSGEYFLSVKCSNGVAVKRFMVTK